ncbi:MAG: HepT-like ribonuclease domain-containing protein [Agriterribacter sp.]
MKPDIRKYFEDMLLSIDIIESHLKDIRNLQEYESDQKAIDSVERRLAIIGEALFKADKLDQALTISDKKRIIGLRHILVHDYDLIDDSTIWLIVQKNLPLLKSELIQIMDSI